VFVVNGRPAPLDLERCKSQNWDDVQVIGAVASIVGKDGPFSQCGWFHRVTWLWLHIPKIEHIAYVQDPRFRNGLVFALPARINLISWTNTPPTIGNTASGSKPQSQTTLSSLRTGGSSSNGINHWSASDPRPYLTNSKDGRSKDLCPHGGTSNCAGSGLCCSLLSPPCDGNAKVQVISRLRIVSHRKATKCQGGKSGELKGHTRCLEWKVEMTVVFPHAKRGSLRCARGV
jgi:hypothetical protein